MDTLDTSALLGAFNSAFFHGMADREQRYAAFEKVAQLHGLTSGAAVDIVVDDRVRKAHASRADAAHQRHEYDQSGWNGGADIVEGIYALAMRRYRDAADLLHADFQVSRREVALARVWEIIIECLEIAPLAFHRGHDSFFDERGLSEAFRIVSRSLFVMQNAGTHERSTVDAIERGIASVMAPCLHSGQDSCVSCIAILGELIAWINEHGCEAVCAPLVARIPELRAAILTHMIGELDRDVAKLQEEISLAAQHRPAGSQWEVFECMTYRWTKYLLSRAMSYLAYLDARGLPVASGLVAFTERVEAHYRTLAAFYPEYRRAASEALREGLPAETLDDYLRAQSKLGWRVPEVLDRACR